MPVFRDRTGETVGKLTVIKTVGKDAHGNYLWECRCKCGTVCVKSNKDLRTTRTCSAACGVTDSNRARAKHGLWTSSEYRSWQQLKQRCLNPNDNAYARYGGRGITVCQEWIGSFEAFYVHIGPRPNGRMSVDRIDNSKGYEPGNVRWATPKQQAGNRRMPSGGKQLAYEGRTQTVRQWAAELGIRPDIINQRLRKELPMKYVLFAGDLRSRGYS